MLRPLLLASFALTLTACGSSKITAVPSVLADKPAPRTPIPAQFAEPCPDPAPLMLQPDGTETREQRVINGQNADAAMSECRRRQMGLIAAWPK